MDEHFFGLLQQRLVVQVNLVETHVEVVRWRDLRREKRFNVGDEVFDGGVCGFAEYSEEVSQTF